MSRRPTPRSSRNAPEAEEGRPRRGRNQAPSMGPLVGLFALLVAALLVAGWAFKAGKQDDGDSKSVTPTGTNPFADLPDGPPTPTGSGSPPRTELPDMDVPDGKHLVERSPLDLLDAPQWVEGRSLAEEGKALAAEAEAAKAAGDQDLYRTKAVHAREKYDAAVTVVADWELDIQDRYSESDRQVRAVKNEINGWYNKVRKYHGLTLPDGD